MFSEICINTQLNCNCFWIFSISSQIDKNCQNRGSWIFIADNLSHLFSNFQYRRVNQNKNQICH